jgi:hypothetical protein
MTHSGLLKNWFVIRRDLPPSRRLFLTFVSFFLPIALWCFVSYVPWIWHPDVKIELSAEREGVTTVFTAGDHVSKGFFPEFWEDDCIPDKVRQFVNRVVPDKFKEGELTGFNNKHLASTNDLEVCKRFIEKYEQVKQIGSENQKEELDLLNLDKYIKDFKNFYLDVQIVKIQEKKEENLKIKRHVQDLSSILPEIIIFQSLL